MAKYNVRLKASVYYDTVIDAKEKWDAEEEGLEEFGALLDKTEPLPSPLEWEGVEVWGIETEDDDAELV